MAKQPLLIGIDGGATKVSAWEIIHNKEHSTFSLGTRNVTRSYREEDGYVSNFKPLDVNVQLNESQAPISLTKEEKQQANVYVEACVQAIKHLSDLCGNSNVLVGIGMPGLKTADKRGISVVVNGPRMLNYADQLEQRLKEFKINLVAPVDHLGSDSDYCGIGENFAEDGRFRNCQNAYYLGGGTGVSDAMKLNGSLVSFNEASSWMAKTWEMISYEGLPLEKVTSVSGIQKMYAQYTGKSVDELTANTIYPLQISKLAAKGCSEALRTFELVNSNLARLFYERIVTLNSGWKGLFEFGNPKRQLVEQHEFVGNVYDRMVIGQRLGDLFENKYGKKIVQIPVLKHLDELIQSSEYLPSTVKKYYKNIDEIVVVSQLREAPALGAGVDAFLTDDR